MTMNYKCPDCEGRGWNAFIFDDKAISSDCKACGGTGKPKEEGGTVKVKPLVFTQQYSQWVAVTPFGTRVYMYESAVHDGNWHWGHDLHWQNSFPPDKIWSRCNNRIEAERQANDWYANVVRSCLDD